MTYRSDVPAYVAEKLEARANAGQRLTADAALFTLAIVLMVFALCTSQGVFEAGHAVSNGEAAQAHVLSANGLNG